MTILEAMDTMRRVLEGTGDVPREKSVAAYNTIAEALDMASNGCLERITLRDDWEMVD